MDAEATPWLTPEAQGIAPGRGRLSGRRILVVGGGQVAYSDEDDVPGNGRAISVLCGREGASVVVADVDLASAEETARLVRNEGVSAAAVAGDASDDADMQRMINVSKSSMGGIDGIVMNVGIDGGHKLSGTDVATWDRVFRINARTHFLGCKYGMPAMDKGGAMVLISSTSAYSASGEVPAMSASKASLNALCLHAAREHAERQVRCNIVAPGLIDTPLGRSGGRKRDARAKIPVPMQRFGTAWETAYSVVFLLSHESAYVTGQTLVVDGGRLVR